MRSEAITKIHELDGQPITQVDRQVHGEVSHALGPGFTERQLVLLGLMEALIHWVVFKHDDAVKQRLAALSRPALYIGQ